MKFIFILEIKIPIKIIVKLKGDAKAIHPGLEGIYLVSHFVNGYPVWEKAVGEKESTYIWMNKNGTKWIVGTGKLIATKESDVVSMEHEEIVMYSLENGPLETNHWAYYNGSEFIISTDISVEPGNIVSSI